GGLEQQQVGAADAHPCQHAPELRFHAVLRAAGLGQQVDEPEAGVVARVLVLGAGVAQADDGANAGFSHPYSSNEKPARSLLAGRVDATSLEELQAPKAYFFFSSFLASPPSALASGAFCAVAGTSAG